MMTHFENDIPVVPVWIHGAFEALPKGSAWPKFTKITVKFGNPIYPLDVDVSKKPEGMDSYQFFALPA